MKKSLLLVILMISLSSFQARIIHAALLNFPVPSNLTESLASIPALPGVPQDDDFLCGDVNEDGTVNVLDIISMVNYILGGSPDPFNLDAADINADDGINVLDIISLVNIILQMPGIPCPCTPSITFEEQTYNTVQIGEQCWFKENLNVGVMVESNAFQTNNGIIEKYCFANEATYCAIYGGLYRWNEAMQYVTNEGSQGICPPNWHIPADDEWKVLEGTVDSQYPVGDPEWENIGWRGLDAGGKTKETGTTHWFVQNVGATNESGFTGLPGGYYAYTGYFFALNFDSHIWSSTQYDLTNAWRRHQSNGYSGMYRIAQEKEYGFSVRCLKGCIIQPSQSDAGPDQLNIPGASATLAGNTPASGSGMWEIVSGTGGTIVDPESPTSEFQGMAGNEYTISWSITTVCGSSEDQVIISFASDFTCGDVLIDDRDGQSYNTILIDTQCMMAENINVGTMIESNAGGQLQTDDSIIEKFCHSNDAANCDIYGGLYEWNEAMQYVTTEGAQGICPDGWHIPTDDEFLMLTYFLGGSGVAGGKMKSTGTLQDGTGLWHEPNTGATNESGLTGLPAGYRDSIVGDFIHLGVSAIFWSSKEYTSTFAWIHYLWYDDTAIHNEYSLKGSGYSIRCLKDE